MEEDIRCWCCLNGGGDQPSRRGPDNGPNNMGDWQNEWFQSIIDKFPEAIIYDRSRVEFGS